MKKRVTLCLLAVLVSALPAGAQTPTPGGGKATIEFLYNWLLALEARVAQLESRTDGPLTEADLVGSYNVRTLGVELGQNPSVGTSTDGFIMRLNANHTLTFQRPGEGQPQGACQLELLGNWRVSCVGPQSVPSGSGTPPTWRYENGSLILITDEEISFVMGAGGRMFVSGLTSNFLPGHSFSDIWVGIRLPNQ